jgi:hypothetical protein
MNVIKGFDTYLYRPTQEQITSHLDGVSKSQMRSEIISEREAHIQNKQWDNT